MFGLSTFGLSTFGLSTFSLSRFGLSRFGDSRFGHGFVIVARTYQIEGEIQRERDIGEKLSGEIEKRLRERDKGRG
jgi:hypothetical protein